MLENYSKDELGVIHQINKKPFIYDTEYVEVRYKTIPAIVSYMSYLRLGYIYNSIPRFTSLLDVGFGSGDFLKAVQNYTLNVSGYDVFYNENLPEGASRIASLVDNYYDIITFFDSLEHFDSLDFVKQLQCNYIVVSVPWCHYLNDDWFENWKHRRPDEHLHHFNHDSLINFMKFSGYKIITYSDVEDIIRKPTDNLPNILTAIFKKE